MKTKFAFSMVQATLYLRSAAPIVVAVLISVLGNSPGFAEELSASKTTDLIQQYETKPTAELRKELLKRRGKETNEFIEGLYISENLEVRGGCHLDRWKLPVPKEIIKAATAPNVVRALNARLWERVQSTEPFEDATCVHIFDILREVGNRDSAKAVTAVGFTSHFIRFKGIAHTLAEKLANKCGATVSWTWEKLETDLFTDGEINELTKINDARRKKAGLPVRK